MKKIIILMLLVMFAGCKKDAEDNYALLAGMANLAGNTANASAATWTVSGTISGLTASGLKLKLNGSEEISPASGDSSFAFTIELADGDSYSVIVSRNPNNMNCTISGSSGSIAGSNITSVAVSCSAVDYSVLYSAKTTALAGIYFSSSVFGDIDGDNDLDLFTGGVIDDGSAKSYLYKNDGNAGFTLDLTLDAILDGSNNFVDIDGDTDLDLILTGNNITKIYKNNGSGNFTLTGNSLEGFRYSSSCPGDFDGDGDTDFFVAGLAASSTLPFAGFYKNDGSGNFSLESSLTGLQYTSCDVGDIDGDGDLDLVYTGDDFINPQGLLKLYINKGNWVFELSATAYRGVTQGSSNFADIDGDGDLDMLITGNNDTDITLEETTLYKNDGNGNFTNVSASLIDVYRSASSFGDVDNDGDLDLVITGKGMSENWAILYINDGSGVYSNSGASLTAVNSGSISFGDADGDGDLDLVITGSIGSSGIAQLYTNNLN